MDYDFTAEGTLLSALLITDQESGIDQASLRLSPDDFEDREKAQLFKAMLAMRTRGLKIDCIGCVEELEAMQVKPDDAVRIVSAAMDGVPVTGRILYYCDKVREQAASKRTIRMIKVANERLGEGESVSWIKSELVGALNDIEAEHKSSEDGMLADAHTKVVEAIRDRLAGDTSKAGLRIGISALDQLTTGINREELWVVGGMPGRGKTALALQAGMNLASEGVPIYFVSLEMSRYAVMRRLLKMKFGSAAVEYPNEKQFGQMIEYERDLKTLPFYVNDSASMEIDELVARARMRIARSGIRLVIVDYIQLIRAEGRDRRERVGEATDKLRRLAKDTGVPVMALSQLRRSQNVNDRPSMIDLKESGDIEAHANVILLLYMPIASNGSFTGEDELIIGKQREGPTGMVPIAFVGSKCQFFERETR
jgi:replicative DNA helicase